MKNLADYLKKIQTAAYNGTSSAQIIKNVLSVVSQMKGNSSFMNAECFFYKEDYENALKCYLELKNFPYQPYFCYRAAAHLCEQRKENARAVEYCKGALEVLSHDYFTLQLLLRLSKEESIKEKLNLLKGRYQNTQLPHTYTLKEFDELKHIFSEQQKKRLFE